MIDFDAVSPCLSCGGANFYRFADNPFAGSEVENLIPFHFRCAGCGAQNVVDPQGFPEGKTVGDIVDFREAPGRTE